MLLHFGTNLARHRIRGPSGAPKNGHTTFQKNSCDPAVPVTPWRSSRKNRRSGVATVEMAFVAPFVLFLIFTSIEFSRMMMIKQSLTNAAREACRQCTLVTMLDHEEAGDLVRHRLRGVVANCHDQDVVRVSVSPAFSSSPDSGTEIVTSVEVNCGDVSWFPTTLFAGAKIRGVASMNRE